MLTKFPSTPCLAHCLPSCPKSSFPVLVQSSLRSVSSSHSSSHSSRFRHTIHCDRSHPSSRTALLSNPPHSHRCRRLPRFPTSSSFPSTHSPNSFYQQTPSSSLIKSPSLTSSHPPKWTHISPPSTAIHWHQATSPTIANAISKAYGFTHCTLMQSAVYKYIVPGGVDTLIRAPTGSGKTLVYLASAFSHILSTFHQQYTNKVSPPQVLVLCPTRELALQITQTAQTLAQNLSSSVNQVHISSIVPNSITNSSKHNFSTRHNTHDIMNSTLLVATPGRLLHTLQTIPDILKNVNMCIIDEADRLLDDDFIDQINIIIDHLPINRQTLLFSATFSKSVQKLVTSTLRPDYAAITTVNESGAPTVDSVRQFYAVTSMSKQPALVHSLLYRSWITHARTSNDTAPFKVIVFLPTVSMTIVYAKLLRYLLSPLTNELLINDNNKRKCTQVQYPNIIELHSKLTNVQRSRHVFDFQNSSSAILVTSDVSARGVDYSDIQLVIQLGMPPSIDMYIHRIGRTARAGKSGVGVLIVSPIERGTVLEEFLVHGVPIVKANMINGCVMDINTDISDKIKWDLTKSMHLIKNSVRSGAVEPTSVSASYLSQLGYYENLMPRLMQSGVSGYSVVKELDALMNHLGLTTLPNLPQALRTVFQDAQELTVDKRHTHQSKLMVKSGTASKKVIAAAQRQHRNNFNKIVIQSKRRKAQLNNEYMYQV